MDYEKIAEDAKKSDNVVKDNVALKSVIVEASSMMMDDHSSETRRSIQEFLDAPLESKKDIAIKKAFAAAMVLAKDKGLINLPDNAGEIAAVIDEGLVRVKANYQVGAGILESEKAIDNIIDHAEARAIAYIDYAFDSGLVREFATEGVVRLAYSIPGIGPILGPIADNYRPIISNVISFVEEPVKSVIKTGIHLVSSYSKSAAHAVVEKAKSFAVNTAKKFVSWFA